MSVDSKLGTQPVPELAEGVNVDPQVLQDLWNATQESEAANPLNEDAQRIIELGQKPRSPLDLFPEEDDGIPLLEKVLPEDALPPVDDGTEKQKTQSDLTDSEIDELFPEPTLNDDLPENAIRTDSTQPSDGEPLTNEEVEAPGPKSVTELSGSELAAMPIEQLQQIASQLTAEQWGTLNSDLLKQLDPNFELRTAVHTALTESGKVPDPKAERVDITRSDALVMSPHEQFLEMIGDPSQLSSEQISTFVNGTMDPDYQNRLILLLPNLTAAQLAESQVPLRLLRQLRGDQISGDVLNTMGVKKWSDAMKLLTPDQITKLPEESFTAVASHLRGEKLTEATVQRMSFRSVNLDQIYSIEDPKLRDLLIMKLIGSKGYARFEGEIFSSQLLSHLKKEDLDRLVSNGQITQSEVDGFEAALAEGRTIRYTGEVVPEGLRESDFTKDPNLNISMINSDAIPRISLADVRGLQPQVIMAIFRDGLQRQIRSTQVFDALLSRYNELRNIELTMRSSNPNSGNRVI